ncbi:hypothetical protein HanXRQr2_Chr02g0063981 [Helianthus annuus]|uniref:Uncharacterized protein n=1 Tax=Helianthus annuus TaxID=4232 RepID=A0A251VI94_HELAN|nr:hypothetical protein HanXRQr2_Chr02g0063981 [Helianthus annuus]
MSLTPITPQNIIRSINPFPFPLKEQQPEDTKKNKNMTTKIQAISASCLSNSDDRRQFRQPQRTGAAGGSLRQAKPPSSSSAIPPAAVVKLNADSDRRSLSRSGGPSWSDKFSMMLKMFSSAFKRV